ncbi:hypothetical protein DL96DRAFT_1818766 [Flagelloscypha sp. PMI_526]|nr:hypothetical protein DL96DRAFT_1818766 [Flagelloscypha sp. PMI_526]
MSQADRAGPASPPEIVEPADVVNLDAAAHSIFAPHGPSVSSPLQNRPPSRLPPKTTGAAQTAELDHLRSMDLSFNLPSMLQSRMKFRKHIIKILFANSAKKLFGRTELDSSVASINTVANVPGGSNSSAYDAFAFGKKGNA